MPIVAFQIDLRHSELECFAISEGHVTATHNGGHICLVAVGRNWIAWRNHTLKSWSATHPHISQVIYITPLEAVRVKCVKMAVSGFELLCAHPV